MNKSVQEQIDHMIEIALMEDIGQGDITTDILIPDELQGRASLLAKAEGVVAGVDVARSVFLKTDPSLKVKILIKDGSRVKPGDIIGTISGRVASILKAERTALNFLQRLSGVATITAQYVAETRGSSATIIETRKTSPGLRWLEKYAVRMGGAKNHRFSLGDMVLVKDNHIAALRARGMSLKDIVAKAKEGTPYGMKLEVEITAVDQAPEVVAGGADIIML
ncbi:MAG: carboxylating nicotinate-nucleotide diphosphorylase, partial [Chloroflexota bacterium]|nr:carboxylating nicotinate-nucleotide diphosphorylase [Chloroflexota bacterium]